MSLTVEERLRRLEAAADLVEVNKTTISGVTQSDLHMFNQLQSHFKAGWKVWIEIEKDGTRTINITTPKES